MSGTETKRRRDEETKAGPLGIAMACLEQWRMRNPGRYWRIKSPEEADGVLMFSVAISLGGGCGLKIQRPTLSQAIDVALAAFAACERRSQVGGAQ